jgi:hypothetical protein
MKTLETGKKNSDDSRLQPKPELSNSLHRLYMQPHLVLHGQPKYMYISHAFPHFKESDESYQKFLMKIAS